MIKQTTQESVAARHDRLQRLATELTKRCPATGGNPGDCPLCGVRSLTVRKRQAWMRGLTDEDLDYLVAYHKICYRLKAAAPFDGGAARRTRD